MKLYHYTKISNFESIIQSDFLRFSNISNANDKRERYAELNDDIFKKCYYFCTTKCNVNAALWHHYANEHNGVCLELNLPDEDFDFNPIEYDGMIEDLNEVGISIGNARRFLSHKSKYWMYEEEIRAFYKKIPSVDNEGAYGINNASKYINSVVVGNGVRYEGLGEKTINTLKELKAKKKLFVISWYEGVGKVIENLSPKLL